MLGRGDQPFLSANSPVVLETPRALLRLWEEHDLPELQAICSDPEVMRFVGTGEPWSVDRTRQFMVLSE
ncbi:N-acetyltransferase, partial [Citrobacter sp. AAK_AS5]